MSAPVPSLMPTSCSLASPWPTPAPSSRHIRSKHKAESTRRNQQLLNLGLQLRHRTTHLFLGLCGILVINTLEHLLLGSKPDEGGEAGAGLENGAACLAVRVAGPFSGHEGVRWRSWCAQGGYDQGRDCDEEAGTQHFGRLSAGLFGSQCMKTESTQGQVRG
jgi:hypothetical protein